MTKTFCYSTNFIANNFFIDVSFYEKNLSIRNDFDIFWRYYDLSNIFDDMMIDFFFYNFDKFVFIEMKLYFCSCNDILYSFKRVFRILITKFLKIREIFESTCFSFSLRIFHEFCILSKKLFDENSIWRTKRRRIDKKKCWKNNEKNHWKCKLIDWCFNRDFFESIFFFNFKIYCMNFWFNFVKCFNCDERTSNSTFDKINIELTSLFYHIEC